MRWTPAGGAAAAHRDSHIALGRFLTALGYNVHWTFGDFRRYSR